MCFADISTGEVELCQRESDDPTKAIVDDLALFGPKEVLLCKEAMDDKPVALYLKTRQECTVEVFDDSEWDYIQNKKIVSEHFDFEKTGEIDLSAKPCRRVGVGNAHQIHTRQQTGPSWKNY